MADLGLTRNFDTRAKGRQPDRPFHAHPALFSESLSPPSRAARCYLLAEGGQIDLPLAPRAAEPIVISADRPAGEAASVALRECLDQIATNFVVVMKLDDSEGPHQLRNGFRRLRAVLSAFGPLLDGREVARIGRDLDWLDHRMGQLRDLDVLIAGVKAGMALEEPDLDWVAGDLGQQAERQRQRLRRLMSRRRGRTVLFDLARLVDTLTGPSAHQDGATCNKSVLDMSRAALAACWTEVPGDRRDVGELDAAQRHDLRRKVRHLGNTVDLFRSLYPAASAEPFLLLLRKVQSTLGQLNDIELLTNVLTGYVQSGFSGTHQERAINVLLQNSRLTAATALVEARSAWRELSSAKAFWR